MRHIDRIRQYRERAPILMIMLSIAVVMAGCDMPWKAPEPAETVSKEAPGQYIPDEESSPEGTDRPVPKQKPRAVLEKYNDLLAINPYISGWLKIDDTKIDEPVVYTPQDQNFFLHRAIDGTEEQKGTLFLAVNWGDRYHQSLIYGHNMKDGTAFGSLQKFANPSYGLSHRTIHFDTLYEEREYELYGAFFSQIYVEDLETDEDRAEREQALEDKTIARLEGEGEEVTADELTLEDLDMFGEKVDEDIDIYRQQKDEDNDRFRYYYFTDLSDKDDFDYFAENVKERALYDTGLEAEWGDDFVTLSTCSYQVKNGRFVVVGIRKNGQKKDN